MTKLRRHERKDAKVSLRVSIIIPVFNRVDFTRKCLEALYHSTPPENRFEVIVVDNGSTDGTRRFLERASQQYPRLRVITNTKNLGFAKACNVGAKQAQGKYVLFLNNDTEPQPGWLEPLVDILDSDESVAAVGSKLLYPDGTIQHAGVVIIKSNKLNGRLVALHAYRNQPANIPEANQPRTYQALTAACCLIRKSVFEKVGGFDEGFWNGFEDVDLCHKLHTSGWSLVYQSRSVLIHHESQGGLERFSKEPENYARWHERWHRVIKPDFLMREDGTIEPTEYNSIRPYTIPNDATRANAQLDDGEGVRREEARPGRKRQGQTIGKGRGRGEFTPAPPHPLTPSLLWHAPIFDPSGYADEARQFVLGLDSLGVNIRVVPLPWSEEQAQLPPGEFARLQDLTNTPAPPSDDHLISVFQTFPPHFQRVSGAAYHIGRTMFETDRIPEDWVAACNQMDEIWVPSDFNVESFARSGVPREKLIKMPEGINVERYRMDTPPVPIDGRRGFNFLSVFDWTQRKGWDVLLRAFIEEFPPQKDVALILKVWSSYGQTLEQLQEAALSFLRQAGLADEVPPNIVFYEANLPTEQLPGLYRAADAFVLPTRGEGWGRPFMEAMLMGLPTIGTRWSGHLEFMNHDNAYLIDCELVDVPERAWREVPTFRGHRWAEPSLDHLRQLMREVYEDRQGAQQKAQAARENVLANYSRERVAQHAKQRLEAISHQLSAASRQSSTVRDTQPVSHITQHATRNTQYAVRNTQYAIRWEGSHFVHHSMALINRELCLRLIDAGHELSIVPHEDEEDQFGPEADERFHKLAERVNAPLSRPADVHVRHRWPPNFAPPSEGHWVMIQPWEYGSLPKAWVQVMSRQIDEVWVPSSYVRDCYIQSGMPADRVHVVPNGVDPSLFHPDAPPLDLSKFDTQYAVRNTQYKFLFVGAPIGRKGIDLLIKAYLQAFNPADDVCLVIKDAGAQSFYKGQSFQHRMRRLIRELETDSDTPAILCLDQNLSPDQLPGLYTACDCLVHPYRGEGFGLPMAEAMACGRPVIVTDHGAALDFCDAETAYLIPAAVQRLPERRIADAETVDYPWLAEPDIEALVGLMRHVHEHRDEARAVGERASAYIRTEFTWDRAGDKAMARLRALQERPVRRYEGGRKMENGEWKMEDGKWKKGIRGEREKGNKGRKEKGIRQQGNKGIRQQGEKGGIREKGKQWDKEIREKGGREGGGWRMEGGAEGSNVERSNVQLSNFLEQADTAIEEENLSEARTILNEAVAAQPDSVEARAGLASVAMAQGDHSVAQEQLISAIELTSDEPELYNQLGTTYYSASDHQMAEQAFQQALDLDPANLNARMSLAEMARAQGRYDETARHYIQALEEHTDDVELLVAFGRFAAEINEPETAQAAFQRALDNDPSREDVRQMLETLDQATMEREDTRSAMVQGSEGKSASPHHGQGTSTPPLPTSPAPEGIMQQANEALNRDDLAEASRVLEACIEQHPTYPEAYVALASVANEQGDHARSQKLLLTAMALDAGRPELYNQLGCAYFAAGEIELAEDAFHKALDLAPDDPDSIANLTEVYRSQQRYEEAARLLTEALETHLDNVNVLVAFGNLSTEIDEPEAAQMAFERAAQLDPTREDVREALGRLKVEG